MSWNATPLDSSKAVTCHQRSSPVVKVHVENVNKLYHEIWEQKIALCDFKGARVNSELNIIVSEYLYV